MVNKKENIAKVTGSRTIKLNKDQTFAMYKNKEQELNQITSKIKEVETLLTEVIKSKQTLKEIKTTKSQEKILVNVGAGILVECEVTNKENAKITLPGNIMVDKDINTIIKDIESREDELNKLRNDFMKNYNQTVQTLKTFSYALNQLSKAEQKNKLPSEMDNIN